MSFQTSHVGYSSSSQGKEARAAASANSRSAKIKGFQFTIEVEGMGYSHGYRCEAIEIKRGERFLYLFSNKTASLMTGPLGSVAASAARDDYIEKNKGFPVNKKELKGILEEAHLKAMKEVEVDVTFVEETEALLLKEEELNNKLVKVKEQIGAVAGKIFLSK